MPYIITITNNKSGKRATFRKESYNEAYRELCSWARPLGYEPTSIHGENLVTAGTLHTEFFLCLEMIKHD